MPDNPMSRTEDILQNGIDRTYYDKSPMSRVENLLIELIESGGGGGGGGGSTVAGVTSFNNRRNRVMPQTGDYTASMVTTRQAGKTVQTFIDDFLTQLTFDTSLNETSERAVQNKTITRAINELLGKVLPAGGAADAILTKNTSANYDVKWNSVSSFMLKSTYDRNNNGKVDTAEKADAVQGPIYKAMLKGTSADAYLLTNEDKGVANGVVPLDSTKKILPEYLPDSIMNGLTHGGIFDSSTLTVTLSDAAKSILHVTADTMVLEDSPTVPQGYPANAELYYICTVGGTFASMTFVPGDWLISLGNQWNQLKNGNQVSSVNGQTGAVVLNSDQIQQGTTNLYFTNEEKAKLRGIEEGATKDENVIQSAVIRTLPSGNKVLRLANKNGIITEFEGNSEDLSNYLEKTGDGSNVVTTFTPATTRSYLNGNETIAQAFAKIARIALDLQLVAYTANYNDLINKPLNTGDFQNNGSGNASYPYIDKRANDLLNYWNKNNSYSKQQIDDLLAGLEMIDILIVNELPTRNIRTDVEYWIPKTPEAGYHRWRYVQGDWADLGDTNIDLTEYLKVDGDGSEVTVNLTIPTARGDIADGDSLAVALGKIQKMYSDLKEVAFGGNYEDLENSDLLALKEDLDNYVLKKYNVTEAGKVLVVGDNGEVTLVEGVEGVVRKGTGENSIIGNDSVDDPANEASGDRASAFGDHTVAAGEDGFAVGRYNVRDLNNQYAFQVGNGDDELSRADALNVQWDGRVNTAGQIGMGTNLNPIEPQDARDVTNKFYVDKTIDEKISLSGLMKSMIVTEVPDVEDAVDNMLYLIQDPTSEGHYLQFKKVLKSTNPDVYEMASLGGTQLTMEGSQVDELPTPGAAYAGKVYQYVGSSSKYIKGANYVCTAKTYRAWLQVGDDSHIFYTTNVPPLEFEAVYMGTEGNIGTRYGDAAAGGTATTFKDTDNNQYTRNSSKDLVNTYEWIPILTKMSELTNDGRGTGVPDDYYVTKLDIAVKQDKLIDDGSIAPMSDADELSSVDLTTSKVKKITFDNFWSYIKYKIYQVTGGIFKGKPTANRAIISGSSQQLEASAVTSTELGYLSGVTSAIQTQINNMWKKIYPVGAIYASVDSTSPATLFGGTWVALPDGYYLRAITSGTAGKTMAEQLPNVTGSFRFTAGSQGHPEVSGPSGAFKTATSGNYTYPWPTDGTSGGPRIVNFALKNVNNDLYIDNGEVRPKSFTVYMWRRTA